MVSKQIINKLCEIFKDENLKEHFASIQDSDSYILAKKQEQFLIDNSAGLFERLRFTFNTDTFDSELDKKFGDFTDIFGNYYDLKVGDQYAGSIGESSVDEFGGGTSTDRHYYICTNRSLSKLYVINARKLYQNKNLFDWQNSEDERYIGEKHYKNHVHAVL